MSRLKYYFEILKLAVAYLVTFGVILIPTAILWIGVGVKFGGTAWFWPGALFAAVSTLPLFYFSLYTSYRLSKWFMDHWGGKNLE